jgi:protein-tyrosine phosphatase
MANILVVCTANQCRSPLAAAMLHRRVAQRGLAHKVKSAGLLRGGERSPGQIIEVARLHGFDLSEHRSDQVTTRLLDGADLVLGMTRHHIRDVAVMEPSVWPHAFTMTEFVRRSERAGQKPAAVDVASWCRAIHEGRTTSDLLAAPSTDDIQDPMGGTMDDFMQLGSILEDIVEEIVVNL